MSVGGRWREEVGQKLNAVLKKASAGAKIVASLPRGEGLLRCGTNKQQQDESASGDVPKALRDWDRRH